MPTLHLIDADSSQACPAVLFAVRRGIESSQNTDDRLLLLGGRPLEEDARQAGITGVDRIAVPFGKAWLGLRAIRNWLRAHPDFNRVHCWSIGALYAARFLLPQTPKHLTLVHTPTASGLKCLGRVIRGRNTGPIGVRSGTGSLCDYLGLAGIHAEVDPSLTEFREHLPVSPRLKTTTGRGWGDSGSSPRVVAVLSDHPSLLDATDASVVTGLTGVSLTDDDGEPQRITLVMHPDQRNRLRAQRFLADQSDAHRVVQDTRMTRPWEVLEGCDAALALGRDAGGLSLFWALAWGVPVIASATGPAGALDNPRTNPCLRLAPSDAHKDLAHVLHGALVKKSVRG